MKILFVMDSLSGGGAERSTADLWYFLRESGVQVRVVLLVHKQVGSEAEIISAGFDVHFLTSQGALSNCKEIAAHIKNYQPDIVHSILFKSNLRTRLARLLVKFVHIESLVNCTYDKVRLKDPNIGRAAFYFYKLLDKFTTRWVDHFHSITNSVKDHYVQQLGINPNKITVVYRGRNPINGSVVSRSSLGISDEIFLIINTGRHEFQKGQIFLIKAIEQLVQKGHRDIKLLILGREGNSSKSIKSYIQENKLEDNIILGGYRNDATSILHLGNLFAFPSLYEGLGGAAIEAQAAGLPIICNNLAVLKDEVIVENENAKIFSSEDIESIIEAILFFYEDRSRGVLFGKNSKRNFEKKFMLTTIHNEMLQLYRRLCSA